LITRKSFYMDFSRTIEQLRREKEKLERAIALLEELQTAVPETDREKPRMGRRFIGEDERREISERMKKYWAERRSKGSA
jgi:adenylate kinase family enzyme